MTAAIEADIEAWLQGEIEVPCTIKNFPGIPCSRPSQWVMYVKCERCTTRKQFFLCQTCKEDGVDVGQIRHGPCGTRATVTWIERIKR